MKGDKTQLRTPQIRPYPLQEKFKILFLGGYVYDVTNSTLDVIFFNIVLYVSNGDHFKAHDDECKLMVPFDLAYIFHTIQDMPFEQWSQATLL